MYLSLAINWLYRIGAEDLHWIILSPFLKVMNQKLCHQKINLCGFTQKLFFNTLVRAEHRRLSFILRFIILDETTVKQCFNISSIVLCILSFKFVSVKGILYKFQFRLGIKSYVMLNFRRLSINIIITNAPWNVTNKTLHTNRLPKHNDFLPSILL